MQPPIEARRTAWTMAGVVAALTLGSQMATLSPMYIGALIESAGFSESDAGMVVTAELIALAASLTICSRRLVHLPPFYLAAAGSVIVVVAQLVSLAGPELPWLLCARGVSGIGQSLALLAVSMLVSRSTEPDKFVATAIVGTALLFTAVMGACGAAVERWGPAGFYLVVGSTALLSLPLLLRSSRVAAPPRGPEAEAAGSPVTDRSTGTRAIVVALAAGVVCLSFIGQAAWSFAERSGEHTGLSTTALGGWLAASNLFVVAGSLFAALIADRVARVPAVTIGVLTTGLTCAVFVSAQSPLMFVIPVLLNGLAFGFSSPFVYGTAAKLDTRGTVLAYVNSAVLLTQALTPFLTGVLIAQSSYRTLSFTLAFGAVLGTVLILPACRRVSASQRAFAALSSRQVVHEHHHPPSTIHSKGPPC